MKYWKEVIKALARGQHVPPLSELFTEYPQWKNLHKERDSLSVGLPWITLHAISKLDKHLTKEMRVFEYGGGGSSVFFSRKVSQLVTVEHDKEWFERLQRVVPESPVDWKRHHIAAEPGNQFGTDPADPNAYSSDDVSFKGHHFARYASAIDHYEDGHFDVVLIDGRARPSCMKHSLRKVKVGGWLILDNADRSYYLKFFHELPGFELVTDRVGPTPYVPWFTQTNIWRRLQ